VTFFAYPNEPTTPDADIHVLARTDQDADEAVTFGRGFFPFAARRQLRAVRRSVHVGQRAEWPVPDRAGNLTP
jgi:hypothetical protein